MTAASHLEMTRQQILQRRMMFATDDLIMRVIAALRGTGRLHNAYIVVATDNGFMAGEHRMVGGKGNPYDEVLRAPLLIFGPGIAKGAVRKDLVANIDLLPTFAEIAGTTAPAFVDGRSFLSQAMGGPASSRKHLAIEMLPEAATRPGSFQGYVTSVSTYAAMLPTGEHEAYNRLVDGYEMANIWPLLQPAERDAVLAQSAALAICAMQTCRDAEDAPAAPSGN